MASSTIKTQAAKFDLHRARSASRVTRDRPSARLNQKTHQLEMSSPVMNERSVSMRRLHRLTRHSKSPGAFVSTSDSHRTSIPHRLYSNERVSLIAVLPHEHAPLANHDIRELHDALPHRLLNVRHAVLVADRLDLGLRLLVGLHGDVGEHVVLDLVVEPAVEKVVDVTAGAKVGAADDGAEVKVIRPRLGLALKPVDVVADVVSGDDDEGVHVGDDVREDGGEEHAGGHLSTADCVAERGKGGELKHCVRREALDRLDERAELALEGARRDGDEGGRELASLERVLEILASLRRLALPASVHLLHGVGSVVEPLPDEGEADHLAVAGEHGEVAGAEGLHVALHEIGVR